MPDASAHPDLSFALDVVDKLIKLAAVLIGGLWTWWNYRKGRTYEQRLELEVAGDVFFRNGLYGDLKVAVKNIGATVHSVQHLGTFCVLSVVRADLAEERIKLFRVFASNVGIEPGEAINDTHYWRMSSGTDDIVWVKLTLRVVSNGVEWFSTRLVRVERDSQKLIDEVTP